MKLLKILMVVALMMGDLHLHAQTVGVEYTTELQTNFRESNFVNLLRLNADMPIGKSLSLEIATISIAKTKGERLIDDLQTFSNIEEDNLPLAIAVCGISWTSTSPTRGSRRGTSHTLFMGIRNMNEDYFTSPVTSFFINSSCGIYPTISANYPVANYPVAAVGLHYCYDGDPFKLQASVYNGTGYNRFTGHENIFRVCPTDDGVFGIAQVEYEHNESHYFLGNSVYYNKQCNVTPWTYAEQKVGSQVTILAGCSHAFSRNAVCKDFIGLGAQYEYGRFVLGMFSDYAHFQEANEWATELACSYSVNSHIQLQPVAHLVKTGSQFNSVFCFRMNISF